MKKTKTDAERIQEARERLQRFDDNTNGLHGRYDLHYSEMTALKDIADSAGIFQALFMAYNAGYVRGHRATVNNAYKEKRRRAE